MTSPSPELFAATTDLNAFTGGNVPQAQGDAAIAAASAAIRAWTRRQFDFVSGDIYTDQSGQSTFLLPEMPVVNVSSVQVLASDGVTWITLDPTVAPSPDYTWDTLTGLVTIRYIGQPIDLGYQVRVTYDHGYQAVPDTVKQVCVMAAARILANPYGAQRLQTGGVYVQFAHATSGEASILTEVEKAMLGRFTTLDVA